MLNFCGGARITQSNLWIFREIQTLLATQSSYLVSHSAPSHRSALNHRTWVAWLSQHDRISCYTDICKINNLPGVGCPFSAGFIFLFQLLWNFMVATEVSGNRINWFPQKKGRERSWAKTWFWQPWRVKINQSMSHFYALQGSVVPPEACAVRRLTSSAVSHASWPLDPSPTGWDPGSCLVVKEGGKGDVGAKVNGV